MLGTAGAGTVCDAGAVAGAAPSKTLFRDRPWITVRTIEVVKNTAAKTAVARVKKFAPPELPKMVWLDPPSDALMSAPLPDWTSTKRQTKIQLNTWIRVIAKFIDSNEYLRGYGSCKEFSQFRAPLWVNQGRKSLGPKPSPLCCEGYAWWVI